MFKKFLIILGIIVWLFVGSLPIIYVTLERHDLRVKDIPIISVGALWGPFTLVIFGLSCLLDNNTILIHKPENKN